MGKITLDRIFIMYSACFLVELCCYATGFYVDQSILIQSLRGLLKFNPIIMITCGISIKIRIVMNYDDKM